MASNPDYARPVVKISPEWECVHGSRCPLKFALPIFVATNKKQKVFPCPAFDCSCASLQKSEGGNYELITIPETFDPMKPPAAPRVKQQSRVRGVRKRRRERATPVVAQGISSGVRQYWADLSAFMKEHGLSYRKEVDPEEFARWRKSK